MRAQGDEMKHPTDEDLSLHPSEQRPLAGDPEFRGVPATSRRNALLPVRSIRIEQKNSEIPLLWLLRQRPITLGVHFAQDDSLCL